MLDSSSKKIYQSAEDAVQVARNALSRGQSVALTKDGNIGIKVTDTKKETSAVVLWFRQLLGSSASKPADVEKAVKSALSTKMKIDIASAAVHSYDELRKIFDEIESTSNKFGLKELCEKWIIFRNQINAIKDNRTEVHQIQQQLQKAQSFIHPDQHNSLGAPSSGDIDDTDNRSAEERLAPLGELEKSSRQTQTKSIEKELISRYELRPYEARLFARDLHEALRELNCSYRDLRDFRVLLIDKEMMPKGISKKTELSAALAVLQQMERSTLPTHVLLPDEEALKAAWQVVSCRIKHLPVLQGKFPQELRIDCVHQGATHAYTWGVSPAEFGQINKELKSHGEYPPTKDASILKTYPQLGILEEQFGKDFHRQGAVFRINGKIDLAMSKAWTAMKKALNEGKADKIKTAKTACLDGFIKFFGNENAASLASYYMSQTIMGTLLQHWVLQGNPLITVVGDRDRSSFDLDVDIVGSGQQKKCIIEARSAKNGPKASNMLPVRDSSGALTHNTPEISLVDNSDKDQGSIEPAHIDRIRVALDFSEMSEKTFNPKIIEAQLVRNIQIDWRELDKTLAQKIKVRATNS